VQSLCLHRQRLSALLGANYVTTRVSDELVLHHVRTGGSVNRCASELAAAYVVVVVGVIVVHGHVTQARLRYCRRCAQRAERALGTLAACRVVAGAWVWIARVCL
jgi:hypothetical protein